MSDYEPYGKEWEKCVSKMPKSALIEMVRRVGKERAEAQEMAVNNLGRAVVAENENAEFKRQKAAGELIPLDVVHKWGCYVEVDCPDGQDSNELCRKSLQQFAAEQARNDAK
jgi:hypothetical protein